MNTESRYATPFTIILKYLSVVWPHVVNKTCAGLALTQLSNTDEISDEISEEIKEDLDKSRCIPYLWI